MEAENKLEEEILVSFERGEWKSLIKVWLREKLHQQ